MVGWCGTGIGFDDTFAQRHDLPPSLTRHETDQKRWEQATCQRSLENLPRGALGTGTFSAGIHELFGVREKPAADFHTRGKSYREKLSHPGDGRALQEARP